MPEARPNIARQLYLKPRDFEVHGMTRGCPKCDYFLKYGQWGTKPHSIKCRERMTTELAKDPDGQRRIAAAASRLDITVEKLGEPLRVDRPQGEMTSDEHVVVPNPPEVMPPPFLPVPDQELGMRLLSAGTSSRARAKRQICMATTRSRRQPLARVQAWTSESLISMLRLSVKCVTS